MTICPICGNQFIMDTLPPEAHIMVCHEMAVAAEREWCAKKFDKLAAEDNDEWMSPKKAAEIVRQDTYGPGNHEHHKRKQMKCECCCAVLGEQSSFSAFWPKKSRRADFCKGCLGEIFFGVLPKVTDSKPGGSSGPIDEDAGSYGSVARRVMEEGRES